MSEELAGFGDQPWLPLLTRKAMRSEARRELAEAKADEAAREQRAESRRSADLALYAQQAEERGEAVSAHALATGQVAGRTVTAILAMAEAMADIDDRRAAAQERRENGERLNICWEPPRATRAMSPEEREVANTVRHYAAAHPDSDVIDRALVAAEARRVQRSGSPVI